MNKIIPIAFLISSFGFAKPATLEKDLKGVWVLKSMTCNGAPQTLSMDYTLSFDGKSGAYTSVTKGCTQIEPELYTYPKKDVVTIKQGTRVCTPTPCTADLPASECGKETNPKLPAFKVEFADAKKSMVLSTNDPNSIDCTAAGQSKPAVFKFAKK